MTFVLDTNVLSERTKPKPDAAVMAFLRAVPVESVRLSAVVLGEVAQGVANNPTPDLKTFLADVLALPLAEFGEAEALEWGRMTSGALKSVSGLKKRPASQWLQSAGTDDLIVTSAGKPVAVLLPTDAESLGPTLATLRSARALQA